MVLCLVAYDIEDNRIRRRLAHYLEKKGIRLQKSVFAVEIERHIFRRFLRQIEGIAGRNKKVAVFRLCAGCRKNALQIGKEKDFFYIF